MTFFWIFITSFMCACLGWRFGFYAGIKSALETQTTEKENEL